MSEILGICAALALMVIGVWGWCEMERLATHPEPDWHRMTRLLVVLCIASAILGGVLDKVLP